MVTDDHVGLKIIFDLDQLACKSAFPLLHHVGSHPRISSRIIGHFIAHSRNGKG